MFSPLQQVYIDSLKKQLAEDGLTINRAIPYTFKEDNWWIDEWNRVHIKSVELRNNLFADYCEELITKAKQYYYSTGESIMSDSRYDSIEDSLRSLRPDSKVLVKVGVRV